MNIISVETSSQLLQQIVMQFNCTRVYSMHKGNLSSMGLGVVSLTTCLEYNWLCMFKMSLAHSFIEISNTVSYIIARKNKLM
jgi:hypothetical protein